MGKTEPQGRRRKLTDRERKEIRSKTGGYCHICGGKLGKDWQADHVRPFARGGTDLINNFLPACPECNLLKKKCGPAAIREIFRLGIYARNEARNRTTLGESLRLLYKQRYGRILRVPSSGTRNPKSPWV